MAEKHPLRISRLAMVLVAIALLTGGILGYGAAQVEIPTAEELEEAEGEIETVAEPPDWPPFVAAFCIALVIMVVARFRKYEEEDDG